MIELPVLQDKKDNKNGSGRLYWRSKSQFDGDPEFSEFVKNEFLPEAAKGPSKASRRQFMQLMGASIAMAGLAGCRKPAEKILPYSRAPEEVIPGIPMSYASAMPFRGVVLPIVVESHEGRPTKIEGNAEHPGSSGASGVFEQASILNLYDPDRSQSVLQNGNEAAWVNFVDAWRSFSARGASVAVIAPPSSSPTLRAAQQNLSRALGGVRWIEYSPIGDNSEVAGYSAAYRRTIRPHYKFENASVIVSLDADFLSPTTADFVNNTNGFSRSRAVDTEADSMSRLYCIESQFSITGGMADNRMQTRSCDIPAFAAAIAEGLGISTNSQIGNAYSSSPFVEAIVEDMRSAGPRAVVLAGDTQPPEVHALCAAINQSTGANGTCVELLLSDDNLANQATQLLELRDEVREGRIDAVVVIDTDIVYSSPASYSMSNLLEDVPMSVHLGMHVDATAEACDWHIPLAHYLEAWGDGRAYDGTLSVVQPLIAPLVEGAKSEVEFVNFLASGVVQSGYDLVRTQWASVIRRDFENQWRKTLHDGFLPGTSYSTFTGRAASPDLSALSVPAGTEKEVVFRLSSTLLDGSYANNAWLLETPDVATKIVWDNVAVMSESTANEIGVAIDLKKGKYYADRVNLSAGGQSVSIPAWILPGHPDNSITVNLGFGRYINSNRPHTKTNFFDTDDYTDVYGKGAIGSNIGVNLAAIRPADFGRNAFASIEKGDGGYLIATTQDHGAMEHDTEQVEKRNLFRMTTLAGFKENPTFASDAVPPLEGLEPWEDYPELWEKNHPTKTDSYKDNPYHAYQWGMVIDLNSCTGCNVCMVACQSENNIQIVGKEEVTHGREMHWIRLDRYFVSGHNGSDNPKMVVQPVPCMHCEDAPCESVCPVAATVHSPDGTNQMIYNRCIGTRYCANNCPYKVRRFNFYNWTKTLPTSVHFAQNPDVTVRSRGVMEKCSYCIQRVRQANKRANIENRAIEEGEVKTACQQACPANAIAFGNLNDAASDVSKKRSSSRRYEMLAELNVKPRTSYLGRVENPNPKLA